LRGSSQLIRKNIPGFINTLNKILKQNPSLRVEFEDEFSDIENQFAQLNTGTMSDVSPMKISDERYTDADKLLAGTTAGGAAYAARKPLLKTLGAIARPFGFPIVGGGLGFSELLSEDPNYSIAGADFLLPEIAKKTTIASRVLNPFGIGRFMTPVGTALITGDTLTKRAKEMMETSDKISNMEAGDEQDSLLEEYAAKDYRGYEKGGIASLGKNR
jgi:hypothetical protein